MRRTGPGRLAQAALTKGDFQAYGEAQNELKDAIERAVAAQPSTSTPVLRLVVHQPVQDRHTGRFEHPVDVRLAPAARAPLADLPRAGALAYRWRYRRGVEQLGSSLGS